jgi:hypothetical protein
VVSLLVAAGPASGDTIVTFDDGPEGWSGPQGPGGSTVIDPSGGNPGANLHTVFSDFGITFRNTTNTEFVGDYTQFVTFTLEIDTKVESIDFFGTPVPRPWLVELRDYDDPPAGYPFVSVWYKFADVSEATHATWTTFSVTVADTSAEELPAGWGGTGAEHPQTFEPILPADRTFSSVLEGVDEIVYTTFEPGFFFGETAFDLRIDNVSIASAGTPVPGAVPQLLLTKADAVSGDLILSWQASCGASAQDYGIYEGRIGTWYGHIRIGCSDAGGDRTERIAPGDDDRYYLVVPLDTDEEGSYGLSSEGDERPPGLFTRCRGIRNTDPCI